ncbi:hypothetical protein [Chryseobacterium cucumeris]|nr:hypothetical protein [Chryseobacterium cucumeris]
MQQVIWLLQEVLQQAQLPISPSGTLHKNLSGGAQGGPAYTGYRIQQA